jgi:hypothetical protein
MTGGTRYTSGRRTGPAVGRVVRVETEHARVTRLAGRCRGLRVFENRDGDAALFVVGGEPVGTIGWNGLEWWWYPLSWELQNEGEPVYIDVDPEQRPPLRGRARSGRDAPEGGVRDARQAELDARIRLHRDETRELAYMRAKLEAKRERRERRYSGRSSPLGVRRRAARAPARWATLAEDLLPRTRITARPRLPWNGSPPVRGSWRPRSAPRRAPRISSGRPRSMRSWDRRSRRRTCAASWRQRSARASRWRTACSSGRQAPARRRSRTSARMSWAVRVYQLEAPISADTLLELRNVMATATSCSWTRSTSRRSGAARQVVLHAAGGPVQRHGGSHDPDRRGVLPFPAITVMGATTDKGLLPEAFVNRFPIKPPFADYSQAELEFLARGQHREAGRDARRPRRTRSSHGRAGASRGRSITS